ncbi:MAG: carboxypeptidase-like regulatory domain-containing protein [Bacteroidetes bacterium]|nr:carboxypeptidase-like regulatory domain-containing protein [Bacteroidota bacterium]
MKKYVLILLLFNFCLTYAQNEETTLTLTFEDSGLKSVLDRIEQKTDYQFFYVAAWLKDIKISGSYQDIEFEELLVIIFNETLLNFYVTNDNRIILTKNNSIYDELPEGFFRKTDDTTTIVVPKEEIKAPIFFNETTTYEVIPIETIRIGKEDKNAAHRRFTLTGNIVNETNGGPASNIVLTIKGKNIGTVTEEDGSFTLELPAGVNIIETSSLGYQKTRKRVIIYSDASLEFGLKEAVEELREVLIQANVDRNVKDEYTGVTRINVDEIKNIPLLLGERDIFKVAATLPGISTAGEGASGYNVRGGRTDQNLILLDDGVIYNPAHFFGIFSAINPYTSNEVTIYKGHVPAKFGGRLSSVFDIKTKDATIEKFSGEASIGLVTSNIVLEAPVTRGTSGILIGARSTYSDWILQNLDEEELRKSEASFYDVVLKYNHKLNENDEIKATGYYSKDAFSITSDSLYGYSNRMVALKWGHTFNDRTNADFILTGSQYKFNIDFDGQSNRNFELGYVIDEYELKLNIQSVLNKSHTLNYGLSSKLYSVEPGKIRPKGENSIVTPVTIAKEQGLESAAYVSDIYNVNEALTVEAGVRFSVYAALGEASQNIYEDGLPKSDGTLLETQEFGKNDVIVTYGAPEVRLSARYLIRSDFSVKGSFNTNYQYIHILSSNTTVSPIDTWKLSDLNIRPQHSKQYSLGLFKNFDDNNYELSLEGYFKKVSDILDYKVGAQLLLNEILEQEILQGQGKAYGVELLLKKTNGRWNGWVGYTYSRSYVKLDSEFSEEQVNGGDYFPSNYDKPHDFSIVGNFKLTKRYSFSANLVYQTGRPVTVPVGNFVIHNSEFVLFSDRNEYRIPDYYRLDISFNIEGNHKIKKLAHSFWNISIYNVLGRNNPYSVFFLTEEGEVKAYQSSIFSIPIPTISYNLKF